MGNRSMQGDTQSLMDSARDDCTAAGCGHLSELLKVVHHARLTAASDNDSDLQEETYV
jgi:hypothetical protein